MNRCGLILLVVALALTTTGCSGFVSGANNSAQVAPMVTTQPANQTVTVGQTAAFSVAATGTAPLAYQWKKNGVAISGAVSSDYTTPTTANSDNGAQFIVLVSNSVGSVTSGAAMLSVNAGAVAPSITTQPTSQTVMTGQTATFSVPATGTGPLSYQWQKNGTVISGATSSSYTTPATTTSDNGAQFIVLVTNSVGSLTSSAAALTVSAAPPTPSITTQPVSQSVTVGQTASFSVAAAGANPLSYQWQKNGANIVGATTASYTTPATMTSDSGSTFRVVVSNTAGTVTSAAATLMVNAAPAPGIQVSPASINFANAVVGTTLSQVLIITNTGTATLSVTQVTESGSAFAVSGFSLPLNVSAGQRTTITVAFRPTAVGPASGNISVVSNATGSPLAIPLSGTGVASTFLLGANPTTLNFANVNVGSTGSLSVTLTNNGNSNVTISSVTVAGAGFSATGVTSATVLTPNQSIALNPAFTPTAAGSVTGSVSVLSNATNSPATISLSGVGVTPASSAFITWVAPSLVRVGATNAPGTTSSISLSGARGETIDTQIIVTASAGGLTNVNLSPSALTGPGGATIAASNVVLYREYYVTVSGTVPQGGFPSGGTNPPLGSGTYAEPLIPFNDPATGLALCGTAATLKACNATINAGQNQPYWIDISVPRGPSNSPPGTYTGTITVTSTQGNVTVPITVTVWNFELPLKPTELSEWTLWNPNTGNTVATLAQALMRNKVMSRYDNAISAVPNMATFGMNRVGLDGSFYIGMQCGGAFSSLPTQAQIAVAAATFPLGLPLDEYVADELTGCSGAYSNLKTLARNLHANGVKSIATFNAVDPNLQDDGNGILPAIDHWVLLTAVQQWPALPYTGKGDLWSYTSCNIGFGNPPEWLIDYPPINERIQAGFLDWMEGAAGVLYYRADGWTSGNAIGSWDNLNVSACGSGSSNPGDGIFLYPPGPLGSTEPAPGIRLKAIRDGIQDYEYVQILKNLGQGAFASSVIQPIAASWTNWTHDPNALEGARLQLGQQLHQLGPSGHRGLVGF